MLNNTKWADPGRDEVTCPFNPAHVLVASRLGWHLIKCEKNYPDIDKAKCKFNADHIVPKQELEHHMANCPNRKIWESFTHKVGNSQCPVKNAVPIHVDLPPCGEDWDDAPAYSSPLEVIQEKIAEKPIMRVLAMNGRTKSERKQFKLEEQQRLRKLEDERTKNDEKKAPKKEQPKPPSNAPLRLPKTSKLGESSSSQTSARHEREVSELSTQLQSQNLTDDYARDYPSGFDKDTYYDNKYMGGYSVLPPSARNENTSKSCSYNYEEDCPESYEGRGYDVEYYDGYTGGYGDEKEVEEEYEPSKSGPTPRWLARGRGKQLEEVQEGGRRLKTVQDNNKQLTGIQSRLVQLKEVHRAQNLQKQEEVSVNVKNAQQKGNSDKTELSPTDSLPSTSTSSSSSPSSSADRAKKEHFKCEVDEMGFLKNPITSKGRGTRRF